MIYSGMRIGELRDLKKEHVHLDERYFYIDKSKTPSRVRNVPISKKVLPFFNYWIEKESKCDYLITIRKGRYFHDRNFGDSYWNLILKEIGISSSHKPQDTRYTCVSLLAKAEVDDKIVKKIVGHTGQCVTEIVYTHLYMEQLLDAIDKI